MAALPGTNANLESPYQYVLTADGFKTSALRDASGATVGAATLLALAVDAADRRLGAEDGVPGRPAGARYAVVDARHGGDGVGTGHIRPVYDRAYWESTAGTAMSWIPEYRLGGGAGVWTDASDAHDTDTSDPNVVDLLVPAGASQAQVLDWRAGAPVVLPYVPIG